MSPPDGVNWQPFRWGDATAIGKWMRTPVDEDDPSKGWLYAVCNGGKSFKPYLLGNSLFVVEHVPGKPPNPCRWYPDWTMEVQA